MYFSPGGSLVKMEKETFHVIVYSLIGPIYSEFFKSFRLALV